MDGSPEQVDGRPDCRVVLADDHSMVRAGLRVLIEEDAGRRVVGEAGNLARLRSVLATELPDLLVLDITLGRDTGLDALPGLLTEQPGLRIIVLTMHDDPAFAREALSRGAHGYLLKEAAAEELTRAIDVVMAGGTYLYPELGARMARARPSPAERLTGRERDVLRLLARGHTNAEIAQDLFISLRTVEAHRSALRTRLGAGNRAQLVEAARSLGLLA